MNRRTLLHFRVFGFFGSLCGLSRDRSARAALPIARSCIFVWLNGGPSHIDTFDPKPRTKAGGPTKAIATRTKGMQLAACFAHLAERSDKFTIIRSMTSKEGNHARAQYLGHTGYAPNPTVKHPSLGSWTANQKGDPHAELPAFVSIGGPSYGSGFLGNAFDPLVLTKAGERPDHTTHAPGISAERFEKRMQALNFVDDEFVTAVPDRIAQGRRAVVARAVALMQSPDLAVFDLDDESAAALAKYGDTNFGRACLLARRLIEKNTTRFVEVVLDGWDTHRDNFSKVHQLGSTLDVGLSALLDDLHAKNLLRSTLVVCMGDFGRTPAINEYEGRDHHPHAWSALVGGGTLRGGYVHGATDEDGRNVVRDEVHLPDLFATLAVQLGLDPHHVAMTQAGRPIHLTDHGKPIEALVHA